MINCVSYEFLLQHFQVFSHQRFTRAGQAKFVEYYVNNSIM